MDVVVERFNRNIEIEEENCAVRTILIDDFNKELEFLISNDIINEKYKSILVKKIG